MGEKHERSDDVYDFALAFHPVMQCAITYWPDLSDQVDIQLTHMFYLTNLASVYLGSLRDTS